MKVSPRQELWYIRVFTCNWESHTEWLHQCGRRGFKWNCLFPVFFNSSDSWRRSSINYHFRLFKFRDDKEVGGKGGSRKQSGASYIVLDFSLCLHFPLKKTVAQFLSLCHSWCQKLHISRAKQEDMHPRCCVSWLVVEVLMHIRYKMKSHALKTWGQSVFIWFMWSSSNMSQWMFTALWGAAVLLEKSALLQHHFGLFLS